MKDSTRRFVLLKLTTDRHEASRNLLATAELLVLFNINKGKIDASKSEIYWQTNKQLSLGSITDCKR